MKQAAGIRLLAAIAFFLAASSSFQARATDGQPTLTFEEVFSLISSNLPGATAVDLSRAAALGLVNQLQPQVQLISADDTNSVKTAATSGIAIENSYAVIHLAALEGPVASEFKNAFQGL